ncbi:acyl-CoA N-acyltransferase [Dactylonectria estremocensis]|uniref:Acyl-CoA N-acyltransferase n=1 Tax=Dactylonectria estremocensis TaxID=1079267 RepID=A0A9P9FL35_9HYPO|nr:acyl-CoA N-acyltransferase [Dactylonectria estremocensis]
MSVNEILTSASPPSEEPGTVLFETERLIVRRYLMSDAPNMSATANHPAVAVNMRNRFPFPYTLSDAESFIGDACKPDGTAYPLHNGIFVKAGAPGNPSAAPLFIGGIGIMAKADVYYRTWELGYWLSPAAAGKGYMTEAVRAFAKWAFATWPALNRLEAYMFARNSASQGVVKKVGFVEEGRRRQAAEKKGELLDEVIFGLLRSDFDKIDSRE